ncbi:MAG: cytochrome c oxidase subunit II [Sphingomonas sp.]|nr:cytochrome c oxidase subunit II [Sphingomonas sp.]|tara:strand:- start:1557 stop:2627 length:1071 start_codon:yes stop_codon:yes gene_type:complete
MRMLGLTSIVLAASLALGSAGHAQAPTAAPATESTTAASDAPATTEAAPADPTLNADGTQKVTPVAGKGQPVSRAIGLQEQYSVIGNDGLWFHNWVLLPVLILISVFVLALLGWVIFRYRRAANPVPSKTSHNTTIEVVWTLVPVLILLAIAVPSIRLLAKQYEPAPDNAVTLKAIGNQWFWSYEYPDNGDISFSSNLLKERNQVEAGQRYRTDADGPRLLATDNRVVLPVNTPIRLITTANDVIHSWAIPAFWVKLDAVPGRLNETTFEIKEPGIYYGQCSELCGARHGFMPITVEAVSPEEYAAWVRAKGGTMPGDEAAAEAASNETAEANATEAVDGNAAEPADNTATPAAVE